MVTDQFYKLPWVTMTLTMTWMTDDDGERVDWCRPSSGLCHFTDAMSKTALKRNDNGRTTVH